MPAGPAAMPMFTQGGYMPTQGSINTRMPVTGSIQTVGIPMAGSVQTVQAYSAAPQYATTTTMGYAGGFAPQYGGGYVAYNQQQAAYNQQMQTLQQAIQLEGQIEKQLAALQPNKDALAKRQKQRDLENKR